jgi:hypothetical protein
MYLWKSLEAVSSSYLFEMECINVIIQLRVHCCFCNYTFLYVCHFRRWKRMCLVYNARTQERFANRLCASCCCLQRAVSPTFSPLHFTIMHFLSVLTEFVRTAACHMQIRARMRGPWEPNIWSSVLSQTMLRSVSDVRQHMAVIFILFLGPCIITSQQTQLADKQEGKMFMCSSRE